MSILINCKTNANENVNNVSNDNRYKSDTKVGDRYRMIRYSCCCNVSAIFVGGTTSNFPSVGLRFRDRRVTLSNANATLDGSFPRDYPAHGGSTT